MLTQGKTTAERFAEEHRERTRAIAQMVKAGKAAPGFDLDERLNLNGFSTQFLTTTSHGSDRLVYDQFRRWTYVAISAIARRLMGYEWCAGDIVKAEKPNPTRRKGWWQSDDENFQRRRLSQLERRKLPPGLKAPTTEIEALDQHEVLDLLERPNHVQKKNEFIFCTVANLYLTGNAWIVGGKDSSGETTMWAIPSTWIDVEHKDRLFSGFRLRADGYVGNIEIPPEAITRLYFPDPSDPKKVTSPVMANWHATRTDQSLQEAHKASFDQGIFPKIALSVGRNIDHAGNQLATRPVLTGEQREQLTSAVQSIWMDSAGDGLPAVLDGLIEDVKILQNTPLEMDYMNSSTMIKERIFQAFGLNPIIVGEITASNKAQALVAERSFMRNVLQPLADSFSVTMTDYLGPWYEKPKRLIVWLEKDEPKDEDLTVKKWQHAVDKEYVTAEEYRREMFGLEPLEVDEDEEPTRGALLDNPQAMTVLTKMIASVQSEALDYNAAIEIVVQFFQVEEDVAKSMIGPKPEPKQEQQGFFQPRIGQSTSEEQEEDEFGQFNLFDDDEEQDGSEVEEEGELFKHGCVDEKKKHMGPGAHPSGSGQDVHAGDSQLMLFDVGPRNPTAGPWQDWLNDESLPEWKKRESKGDWIAEFEVESENKIRVFKAFIDPEADAIGKLLKEVTGEEGHSFSFLDDGGTTRKTGRGEAMQVMRKASVLALSGIKQFDMYAMTFTSSGESRTKLYHRLARRASKMLDGYTGVSMFEESGSSAPSGGVFAIMRNDVLDLVRTKLGEENNDVFDIYVDGGDYEVQIHKSQRDVDFVDPSILDDEFFDELFQQLDAIISPSEKCKHLGPGDHPSGSSQDVHGGGGSSSGSSSDRSANRYFEGDPPKIHGTGKNGKVQLWDVANYLEKQNEKIGELTKEDEGSADIIAEALADEAEFALKQDDSAIGWYDKKMKAAMAIMQEHHPDLKDPDRQAVMKSIIAITSNGQDVKENFKQADNLYRQWRDSITPENPNGKINSESKFGGQTQNTINQGLAGLQSLIDKRGLSGMRSFMDQEITVGELKKAGFDVAGENVDTKVRGAMAFGPKVGSFYGNLNGRFDTVTMDRWFMRTHGRIAGTLTNTNLSVVGDHVDEIVGELSELPANHGYFSETPKDQLLENFAFVKEHPSLAQENPILLRWTNKRRLEYAASRTESGSRYADKTDINKGSKKFIENMYPMNESPENGPHRTWIRESMKKTQSLLSDRGHEISIADIQALLWYNEKRLYTRLGHTSPKGTQTVDYEDAARALFKAGKASVPKNLGTPDEITADNDQILFDLLNADSMLDAIQRVGKKHMGPGPHPSGSPQLVHSANEPKTVKEAEAFAVENGLAGEVSYKGIDVEYANKINVALVELKAKTGKTFDVVYTRSRKRDPGGVMTARESFDKDGNFVRVSLAINRATGRYLRQNADVLNSTYDINIRLSDHDSTAIDKWASSWGDFSVCRNVKDMVAHEYGHLLTVSPDIETAKKLRKLDGDSSISEYAGQSGAETMAEIFALHVKSPKSVSDEHKELFNTYSSYKIK